MQGAQVYNQYAVIGCSWLPVMKVTFGGDIYKEAPSDKFLPEVVILA